MYIIGGKEFIAWLVNEKTHLGIAKYYWENGVRFKVYDDMSKALAE